VIKIDTVAPVVTAAANPATAPKGPKPINVTISGSASDALSGISSASYNVIDEYGERNRVVQLPCKQTGATRSPRAAREQAR
jgi:hypothetical protein